MASSFVGTTLYMAVRRATSEADAGSAWLQWATLTRRTRRARSAALRSPAATSAGAVPAVPSSARAVRMPSGLGTRAKFASLAAHFAPSPAAAPRSVVPHRPATPATPATPRPATPRPPPPRLAPPRPARRPSRSPRLSPSELPATSTRTVPTSGLSGLSGSRARAACTRSRTCAVTTTSSRSSEERSPPHSICEPTSLCPRVPPTSLAGGARHALARARRTRLARRAAAAPACALVRAPSRRQPALRPSVSPQRPQRVTVRATPHCHAAQPVQARGGPADGGRVAGARVLRCGGAKGGRRRAAGRARRAGRG